MRQCQGRQRERSIFNKHLISPRNCQVLYKHGVIPFFNDPVKLGQGSFITGPGQRVTGCLFIRSIILTHHHLYDWMLIHFMSAKMGASICEIQKVKPFWNSTGASTSCSDPQRAVRDTECICFRAREFLLRNYAKVKFVSLSKYWLKAQK